MAETQIDALVLSATAKELEGILTNIETTVSLGDKTVVGKVIGVGKVVSGITTLEAIHTYHPKLVILVGFCGALNENLEIGDIALVEKVLQYDLDLHLFGLELGSTFLPDGSKSPCCFNLYAPQIEDVKRVILGTADRFLERSYRELHPELREVLHLDSSDMEGYAVAYACSVLQTPCAILKVVSDDAKGRRPKKFNKFVSEANKNISVAIQLLLDAPSEKSPTNL